jgi:hypothetical protein
MGAAAELAATLRAAVEIPLERISHVSDQAHHRPLDPM